MARSPMIKLFCQFCRAARVEYAGDPCSNAECQRKAAALDASLRYNRA